MSLPPEPRPTEPGAGRGRGLGRGLGALIPPVTRREEGPGLREVPVDRIRPNPHQPRARIDPDTLEELAQSIREHGVLQPVVVSALPEGAFQLVAGERRWRAAQLAGLGVIPAVVKEATPRASLEMALVENIQRQDLNAVEEALAYKQLLDEHGLTQEALAKRLGRGRVAVTNTLRLLHLPEPVQRAVVEGVITEGHARAILTAEGEERRLALLEQVVAEQLSVRQTEALARTLAAPEEGDESEEAGEADTALRTAPPPDPDLARLEDEFRQALGTRVQLLRRGRKGGRLVIHFFSDDELQGLYEAIVRAP